MATPNEIHEIRMNLRFSYKISMIELVRETKNLMAIHNIGREEAIELAVSAIGIGDFETIGQAHLCYNRLVEQLTAELKRIDK